MHGSWSTRLQPYYPFWEYVGSSDFAYCPIDGVAQKWPEGGALTGQSADSASYCVVNGSIADEIYDYRLATHTIATLQLAKREGRPFFVMAGFRRPHRDFLVHQRYWDMYPAASEIATAKFPVRSKSQPLIAFRKCSRSLSVFSREEAKKRLHRPSWFQVAKRHLVPWRSGQCVAGGDSADCAQGLLHCDHSDRCPGRSGPGCAGRDRPREGHHCRRLSR